MVIGEVTRPYILTRRQRNCLKAYIESDGKMDLGEARVWWKVGKGETINVDISSLQISGVSAKDFGSNSSMALSTENHCPLEVFVVYGDVTAIREGNYMTIKSDTYNFNLEIKDLTERTFKRNVLTLADKVFHNIGNEFKIHINGKQRLK